MKKYYNHFFTIVLCLLFCTQSCVKINIDTDNLEFDGTMNWGIPIVDAEYSIEKILEQFGETGYIKYEANGDYYFEYNTEVVEYIKATDFNKINDKVSNYELLFPISSSKRKSDYTHTFEPVFMDFSGDEIQLKKGITKSGFLVFDFSEISATGFTFSVDITSTTIKNLDNSAFTTTIPTGQLMKRVNGGNFIITPIDNNIDFIFTIHIHSDTPITLPTILFKPKISLESIVIKEGEGRVMNDFKYDYSFTSNFNLFTKSLYIDLLLHNAKVNLLVKNGFDAVSKIILSKAELRGAMYSESLIQGAQTVNIPPTFTGTLNVPVRNPIPITSYFDNVLFEGYADIPAGDISFVENSNIEFGTSIKIPFDLEINQAAFKDTIPFKLKGLNNLSFLDTVIFRLAFNSSIPTNMHAQVYLYNSKNNSVLDSLAIAPISIRGSFNSQFVTSDVQFVNVTQEKLKKLKECDNLILDLGLATGSNHANFNQKNALRAKIGVRIKTANHL